MHPARKIEALIGAGMTQLTISAATGIDQSKISRIASGAIKNPRWDDAEALNVLYAQTINKQPVEPA